MSDWIEWSGGSNPAPGKTVEAKSLTGTWTAMSENVAWKRYGDAADIIAYRLVSPPASAAKGEGEIEFRVTMTRYVMAGDPDDAIERAISEVIGCWDADDFSAVPHPSQQAAGFVPTDSKTQVQMAAIIAARDSRDPVEVIAEARRNRDSQQALASPATGWPSREDVARVIDPWAYGIVANISHTERAAADRAKALDRAAAILALFPPVIAEGGECLSTNEVAW